MESRNKTELIQFNPRSLEFCANPYPTYHRLRSQEPIHYRQERGDWVLTRYADITAVLQNANFAYSEPFLATLPNCDRDPVIRFLQLLQQSHKLISLWVLFRNPPAHTKLRQLLHHSFTSRKIQTLHSRIQAIVDTLIDQVQEKGSMDIIHDLAEPLTIHVSCEILGIPKEEEHPRFKQWLQELSLGLDIDVTQIKYKRGLLALAGLTEYFRNLIAKRRTHPHPQDNLLDILIQAQAEGELSEDELLANCSFILLAGYSGTRHLIGNGMLALLRHPEQLRLLQEDPTIIQTAVNECLRYDSPVQILWRIALSDVNLDGKNIPKGKKVLCVLGAGNRDPAQFSDPDKFDIKRHPNPYLSFGHGIHTCLGIHLAKLEAQIAIETLVRRLTRLALATESLEWEESFLTHGLKSLPVVF